MNYLGHAYLSFGQPGILTGNLIGDYVKGLKALDALPARVAQGVLMHRAIDAFTDQHPAVRRSALLFRPAYGLYAGAIVDTVMDHYLANDPAAFSNEKALLEFTRQTYALADADAGILPEKFAAFFPHMKSHNWLHGYRSLKGAERALHGLQRRANYMPPPDEAYGIFVGHYYQINQAYFELMDEAKTFAKRWLEGAA